MSTVDSLKAPLADDEPAGLYEVVDGRFLEKPAMGSFEAEIASLLVELMAPFARGSRIGRVLAETLFLLDRTHGLKRRPDVVFLSAQRWPLERRAPRTEAWDVVPDLTIEVVSASNRAFDVADKLEEFFRAGVRLVWVVYPSTSKVYVYDSPTSVRIHQLGDELDGGAVLPGFRVALTELFGEPEADLA